MKKLIFTLALGLATAQAAAQEQQWSVTMGGLYAKPFRSQGFSSRMADGYGFNAALESRCRPWLGLGLNAHGLGFRQADDHSSFSGLDLFARLIPIRTQHFEPYALLGIGADYAAAGEDPREKRLPGWAFTGGLGTLIPLRGDWAVDLGVDYVNRPGGQVMQHVQGRLGLQLRLGSGSGQSTGQAPRAEAEASELQTVNLAKGKAQSADASSSTSSTSVPAAGDKRYLIKPGDNLWRIAGQDSVYGNPYKYKKLVEANPELIKDPNLIYPDTKLVLP